MTERKKILLELVREYWIGIEKSVSLLESSLIKCQNIGVQSTYSEEELEAFESLTARFARTLDIFLQKLLRSVFELLEESPFSMLDLLNSAEKKGIIPSADKIADIRRLRNSIAHEYWIEQIQLGFKEAIELTPHLLKAIQTTQNFCEGRGWK